MVLDPVNRPVRPWRVAGVAVAGAAPCAPKARGAEAADRPATGPGVTATADQGRSVRCRTFLHHTISGDRRAGMRYPMVYMNDTITTASLFYRSVLTEATGFIS